MFRCKLQQFGGLGYPEILQLLYESLDENLAASDQDKKSMILQLVSINPIKVLQWREEVEEVIVEGPKWECFNCKTLKEENVNNAKFEKNEKVFCCMKCISECRKKGLL